MFLEETSLLDPRFKTSYLTEEEGFIVVTRVTSEAANVYSVKIKQETGISTAAPALPVASAAVLQKSL